MSKRSFEEFSTLASSSRYLAVLDHADSLLKAAQSLKQDLERLGKYSDSPLHEKILLALKQHNAQIHPAVQALSRDEVRGLHKSPKAQIISLTSIDRPPV